MPNASHAIRDEIKGVLLFVGAIWAIYFVSLVFPGLDHYGVIPRTLVGLVGIPAMPFLHANLHHLLSNTVPLVVLLILLAGSRAESWDIVAVITVLGGALLWIFGRTAVHIGASGLISGLTTFLILSGLLEQRIIPLFVALVVGFLYGGSLVLGVVIVSIPPSHGMATSSARSPAGSWLTHSRANRGNGRRRRMS